MQILTKAGDKFYQKNKFGNEYVAMAVAWDIRNLC